jgi:hypothetical protein
MAKEANSHVMTPDMATAACRYPPSRANVSTAQHLTIDALWCVLRRKPAQGMNQAVKGKPSTGGADALTPSRLLNSK